ncbi:unnamed protein product [Ceutorhynchus assimilis]|uniref:BHLH domain-containing protein n=1 Tax=Ceutorhynchus assimilis TaxID=467358 RepID=A0A9N9QA43_9CUCU|nr:unnamed protein product [Ceutorhynchus assimilis]
MSQISVVQYNNSVPQKILQQQSANNDRQIIILRKPTAILPQPKDEILLTNPGRKGPIKKDMKTNPQPIAVARRNARERNRVKQVNNGFANLRQRIPNFIAQAFETNNGRGNKKLSKVETLRMAVEYIRSLEDVLALDGYTLPNNEENTCPSPLSQNNDSSTSQNDLNYNFDDDEDDFSSVATPSPQQYIRINTSNNTFEIVPSLYENSENMDPMSVMSELDLQSQDLSYLQVNTTDSLSPGMYSEGSLSPQNDSKVQEPLPQNCFIPVFATGRIRENFNVQVKTELDDLPVLKAQDQESLPRGMEVVNWWDTNAGGQQSS